MCWVSGKAWVRVQGFHLCSVSVLCGLLYGREDAKNVKFYSDWIQMFWPSPPFKANIVGFFFFFFNEIEYLNLLVSFASPPYAFKG